jgi:CHAT domain-containing protein/Flp pilus assembly protein TadD
MIVKFLVIAFFLIVFSGLNAQVYSFDQIKKQYDSLRKAEDHLGALVTAKQMHLWVIQNESDTSFKYLLGFEKLGFSFYSLNKLDSAELYFSKTNDLFIYQGRDSTKAYVQFLKLYAILKRKIGDFNGAEIIYQNALDQIDKKFTSDSLLYGSLLNNYGFLKIGMGLYEDADSLLKKALLIYESKYAKDKQKYTFLIHSLALLEGFKGNFKEADRLFKDWMYLAEAYEKNPSNLISGINDYAEILIKQEKFIEAREYLNLAKTKLQRPNLKDKDYLEFKCLKSFGYLEYKLRIMEASKRYLMNAEKSLKNDTIKYFQEYADINEILGDVFINEEKYDLAEVSILKSLKLREKYLSDKHPDFATSLNQLSKVYKARGQYDLALSLRHRVLEIRKETLPVKHPDYSSSINNLGNLYLIVGDYAQAEKYYLEALELRKIVFSENHSYYAASLHNLGDVFFAQGDFKKAVSYYDEAIEVKRKLKINTNLDYFKTCINLTKVLIEIGSYDKAEKLLTETISTLQKLQQKEHTTYANALNQLGLVYYKKGQYDLAEKEYLQCLEIIEKNETFGKKSKLYSDGVYYLGRNYLKKKDFINAEKCFRSSLDTRLELYNRNTNHPDIAKSYKCFGDLYFMTQKYDSSEYFYFKAFEINKRIFGENHRETIKRQIEIANLYTVTGRMKEAFELNNRIFDVKLKEISDLFEWLTDEQKEDLWKIENRFYFELFDFGDKCLKALPEVAALNYNASLIMKGKLLESKISSENYYWEVDKLRDELAIRKRLYTKIESEGFNESDSVTILSHNKLHFEIDSLDRMLMNAWPNYKEQKEHLSINWEKVQDNLTYGEAAIEFVRFLNKSDSLYYYNALILKPGEKYPILVKLCQENQLKSIKPTLGFSSYYPLVWQPMEAALENVKTIYYSPMGELYNIPFHALYAQKENGDQKVEQKTSKRGVIVQSEKVKTEIKAEYLIDRYTLHQLTSTRYLAMGLKQKSQEPISKSIAMVGGVNYDFLNSKDAKPKKQKGKSNSTRSSQSASGKLAYLEGTKLETETIKDSVQAKEWKIEMFSSNDATEDNLVRLEGRHAKSILHIATHGYAFPEYDFKDTSISKNSLRHSYRYSTNPMVRSGLILVGGNWAWTGSDTLSKLGAEQNGILTALEVSQLNLKKTKLVVLSACETGLGKIEGSEGTFGLKRGFKLAGVEQMIVSLWSVPDKETMELMTLFYSDLTKTLNPVTSFEKAQKEMRTKYPTDPEKWAGFVLVR